MTRLAKVLSGLAAALATIALMQTVGAGAGNPPQSSGEPAIYNMRLLGYDDLDGRTAYHPWVEKQGSRYILYVAHHAGFSTNRLNGQREGNGTSIIDVTDPTKPVYLTHLPSQYPEPDNEARHARVCQVGDKYILLRTSGQRSHDLYDVTNPAKPTFVKTVLGDLTYTHKPWWDCKTGYMFLPSNSPKSEKPAWRANHVRIFWQDPKNISTPVKFVRAFGIDGQQPGSSGPIPSGIHMPLPSVKGDRIYFGWGAGESGIGQITDYAKLIGNEASWPIPPTRENLNAPVLGTIAFPRWWGIHSVYELKDVDLPDFALGQVKTDAKHDFAILVSEATSFKCASERDITFIYDITDPSKPAAASTFQVPAAAGNYCDKGGRFGPHSGQDRYDGPFYKKMYALAYFRGGVRMVDIRNPFQPVEVAHFIPEPNHNTLFCAGELCDNLAIQTNNTDTDDRGYIYIVDRAGTGTHILELTGDAKAIIQ